MPCAGLQKMVMRTGGTRTQNVAQLERGCVVGELDQFKEKAQGWVTGAHSSVASTCLTLPGPWV